MTSDEIESTFKRKLIHSKDFSDQSTFFIAYIFNIRVMSETSYATIGFTNGKVSSVTYRIVPYEQNPEKLIEILVKIDQLLIDKYGKPELDQIKYINTQTKVSKTPYSYDLSFGNIKFEKIWLTKHLWIQHELYKIDNKVDIHNQSYGHYLKFVCKKK